jgi:hypothetical protein
VNFLHFRFFTRLGRLTRARDWLGLRFDSVNGFTPKNWHCLFKIQRHILMFPALLWIIKTLRQWIINLNEHVTKILRRYYEIIVENRFPIVLTSPSKNACEVVNPDWNLTCSILCNCMCWISVHTGVKAWNNVLLSIFFVFLYTRFCVYYNMHDLGARSSGWMLWAAYLVIWFLLSFLVVRHQVRNKNKLVETVTSSPRWIYLGFCSFQSSLCASCMVQLPETKKSMNFNMSSERPFVLFFR